MDGKAHAHGSEDVGLSIADCDRRASASLRCVDGVVVPNLGTFSDLGDLLTRW